MYGAYANLGNYYNNQALVWLQFRIDWVSKAKNYRSITGHPRQGGIQASESPGSILSAYGP